MIFPADFVNKIICGDSSQILRQIPAESCSLCVTSPPYKDEDLFSIGLIRDVFYGVYFALKPNSLLFLNFGHLADFKSRPFEVAIFIQTFGFNWIDTIVWEKIQYSPIQGKKRLNNLTEFIFMFSKGKGYNLDRLSIGKEYSDASNIKRYGKGKNLTCGGNLWRMGYETITNKIQKLHRDRFPEELPARCIKLSGLKSGIVLEPFAGSGTTCVAAKRLGLDFIAIDKNPEYVKISEERLKNG